jgi:hypothetical protein
MVLVVIVMRLGNDVTLGALIKPLLLSLLPTLTRLAPITSTPYSPDVPTGWISTYPSDKDMYEAIDDGDIPSR